MNWDLIDRALLHALRVTKDRRFAQSEAEMDIYFETAGRFFLSAVIRDANGIKGLHLMAKALDGNCSGGYILNKRYALVPPPIPYYGVPQSEPAVLMQVVA